MKLMHIPAYIISLVLALTSTQCCNPDTIVRPDSDADILSDETAHRC